MLKSVIWRKNKMNFIKTFFVLSAFLLIGTGCEDATNNEVLSTKSEVLSIPEVIKNDATLIMFSAEGEMIDFVHIKPDSKITKIEFHAPENGEKISVFALGSALHPTVSFNMEIISMAGEGLQGKVITTVSNGIVTEVKGDGFGNSVPLNNSHLKQIKDTIQSGEYSHPSSTVIYTADF
jgi:hypothetical protein